jgi:hypothetical protein
MMMDGIATTAGCSKPAIDRDNLPDHTCADDEASPRPEAGIPAIGRGVALVVLGELMTGFELPTTPPPKPTKLPRPWRLRRPAESP